MEAPISTVNLSFLQPTSEVTISTNDKCAVTMVTDLQRRVRLPKTLHLFFGVLDHRYWAGASLFHRSTKVQKTHVWKGWVKVGKRCLSTGYGEAVISGRRRMFSKDLLFQVGLAHWKVIHCSTLEANEKAPQDVAQRGSEWRNTHQFKTCGPGALRGKH